MLDALRYLTVLPMGRGTRPASPGAVVAFPLVGLLIGFVWAVPAALLGRLALPLAVAATIVLALDAVVTRVGLLDAAARVADEITGARRGLDDGVPASLGSAGVTTLVLTLLLRFGLLTFVAGFPALVLVPPVVGRAAMVVAWWRTSESWSVFSPPTGGAVVATLAFAGVLVALPARVPGLTALAGAVAVGLLVGAWARRRHGTVTERDARACALSAETVALMALAMAVIL